MSKLNSYLFRTLLTTFGMAIGITSFVMLLGALAKEDDLLEIVAAGGSLRPAFLFLGYRLPEMFGYTVPLALLAAAVLVFNRLSADNEVTAMRASGVSLLQVVTPLVLFSLGLSALCAWLQFHIMPEYKYRARSVIREEAAKGPLALMEPGRFIEMFPGYVVYIGAREEDRVRDIHICVFDEGKVRQVITARSGDLRIDEEERVLILHLDNAMIISEAENGGGNGSRIHTEECEFPLSYGRGLNLRRLARRVAEMTMEQLFSRVEVYSEQGMPTTPLYVEIHMRAAMALAPFSLLLIGIPVGLRTNRRETSVGLVVCVFVALVYYALMTLIQSFDNRPELHPELLSWLPNVLCQIGGVWGLWHKR